ncbi:RDD family protein [Streptomyces sp. NBC_00448]|uniref:RDD family protein n=1 Tax=Streptomyces sp. NBC_00448 TaxID=2903652 RepID=UPI002E2109B8
MQTLEGGRTAAGAMDRAARRERAREAQRMRHPLTAEPPEGSRTAYACAGLAGRAPVGGGEVATVELASTGRRFAAMVIDLAIAAISLAAPGTLASGIQYAVDPDGQGYFLLAFWLLGCVWLTFYGAVFVALWGGTPGLLLTGLRVVRLWDGHERPTWKQSFRRARFLAVVGWLIPLVNLVAFLSRPLRILTERPYHHSVVDITAHTAIARRPAR